MEQTNGGKDGYFIVTRCKNRKGFPRGSIGRSDARTLSGEVICEIYGGNSSGTSTKDGTVRREDTYPLSRHQAQLLLFVCPASRRLEVLCNVQLFSAICDIAQDDLVMVKYKKTFEPCLVKKLMQVSKKENPDDLNMLGFELELVDNGKVTSKKSATLPLFSAGDIVQVVPGHHMSIRPPLRASHHFGSSRRAVTLINSAPTPSSQNSPVEKRSSIQDVPPIQGTSNPLQVGFMAEVLTGNGITIYGVIRWIGIPEGKKNDWAGLELENEMTICSDGIFGGKRYFSCEGNRALFVLLERCKPDGRVKTPELPPDVEVPPIPESEVLSLLEGRMKGIQGHYNSCYLDATLFSLFSSSMALDSVCQRSADAEGGIAHILRRDIVHPLRRNGFVPAESVMNFRKQLGCQSFVTEEKDPEEFVTILLQRVLHMDPLLKIRSNGDSSQEAYTHQIILEKSQLGPSPSVQQLLETSFISCDLKFEEIPSCLMVQMPRFGKQFKMFEHIIPSTQLDITDLMHCSPRECFICGRLATYECSQCLIDQRLQPGRIKQYCSTCTSQVHNLSSRQGHTPRALEVPEEVAADTPVLRHHMELFAVLCIHTSHYVSFVKYGPDNHSWLFFDSMADRCGNDSSGYNIPVVKACPEVGAFLSQPEVVLAQTDLTQTSELVHRLLSDSYMCLYQSTAMSTHR